MYDPLILARDLEDVVSKGLLRKYYRRIRRDRWYGGICTSDCVGCNLRCVFCWSGKPRDLPEEIGEFYSPEQVFDALNKCAKKGDVKQLRISGNEPTIAKRHLFEILRLVDTTQYKFILETNGTLIDANYARGLSRFKNLHVRVSIKGAGPGEFSQLTGANQESFQLQLNALGYLFEAGVSFHPAAMLSFSTQKAAKGLKETLKKMHSSLVDNFEEEYVFLYPHVVKRLKNANVKPSTSYSPEGIPEELI